MARRKKPTKRRYALRLVAVFFASALSVVGAGALVGVEVWQSLIMAGVGGVARVLEGVLRSFAADGDLSDEDAEAVFQRLSEEAS